MFKLLLLSLLILSCSTGIDKSKPLKTANTKKTVCTNASNSIDIRHLVIAAKAKAPQLVSCFKNFLRFEETKKQRISTCNILTIRKSGKVKFAYSRGDAQSRLPKAMKMCMEQEFWKMKFTGLQLEKSYTIKFPLLFSSM
jgi:hypothetical protein